MKRRLLVFGTLVALFLALVWYPLEHAWRYFCLGNYDLGIYAQALSAISFSNPNPWLTVRELKVFNDHFDPILFLLAPFKHVTVPGLFLIRVEMIAVIATVGAFIWLAWKGVVNPVVAALIAGAFIFNRASLSAFFYPAHPGTWAILPLAWTLAFLITKNYRASIAAFIFCLMCKEEYPVVGLAISCGLFFGRNFRSAAHFAVISIFWACLAFFVRPALLGPSALYTGQFKALAGLDHFSQWDSLLNLIIWLGFIFVPFIAITLLVSQRAFFTLRRGRTDPAFCACLAALLALLGIRLMGGWWYSHRSVPVVLAAGFVTLQVIPWEVIPSRRAILIAAAAVLLMSQSGLRPGLRVLAGGNFAPYCPVDSSRLSALNSAVATLRGELKLYPEQRALVQGNILPHLVDAGLVSQLGATQLSDNSFQWLLVERPPSGNTWPLSRSLFDETLSLWEADSRSDVFSEGDVILLRRMSNVRRASKSFIW